jgi:hypothetical protein
MGESGISALLQTAAEQLQGMAAAKLALAAVLTAAATLLEGAPSDDFDFATLQVAVAACDATGVADGETVEVPALAAVAARFLAAQVAADGAAEGRTRSVGSHASPVPFQPATVAVSTARQLTQTWEELQAEAAEALESASTTGIMSVLAHADAAGLPCPHLAELQQVLAQPPRQRLHAQLRRALERGDSDAVATCTLGIKKLFFTEASDSFPLHAFPGLRPQREFAAAAAAAGGGGVAWLVHSSVPLPTSLTRPAQAPPAASTAADAAGFEAAAVAVSNTILAFCGELAFPDPTALAVQLVQVGLVQASLRDEILVQLLRHLNGNPSPASRGRASALLLCCLSFFAPSEALENFVEAFLRFTWEPVAVADAASAAASVERGAGSDGAAPTPEPVSADRLLLAMHKTTHLTGLAEAGRAAAPSLAEAPSAVAALLATGL